MRKSRKEWYLVSCNITFLKPYTHLASYYSSKDGRRDSFKETSITNFLLTDSLLWEQNKIPALLVLTTHLRINKCILANPIKMVSSSDCLRLFHIRICLYKNNCENKFQ